MTSHRVTATADLSPLYKQRRGRRWEVLVYPHLVHHGQWRGLDHALQGHSRAQDTVRLGARPGLLPVTPVNILDQL